MSQLVEVRFKGTRRGQFAWPADFPPPRINDPVIVRNEHGLDFGLVHRTTGSGCDGCTSCGPTDQESAGTAADAAEATVVRTASADDLLRHRQLREEEDSARVAIADRARQMELPMRISDVEWQWDRHRLTVYFTADHRVDFRALVRDLASAYRARVELRQIGVREEAARIGGIGRCGRELCCSTWLTEPGPVNLGLAKDQNLSLNPAQISGGCGRLLCCLRYEHEFYVTERRRFPKEGRQLRTTRGIEKVIAVDILRERVLLRSEHSGTRTLPLDELKAETEAAAHGGKE